MSEQTKPESAPKPKLNDEQKNKLNNTGWQRGLQWRFEKLQIIAQARQQGISEAEIFKELKKAGMTDQTAYTIMNDAHCYDGEEEAQIEPQIDYTKESEQKEQLTKLIETELTSNPKLKESDVVQKFSTKEINEELVAFCFDIAKNHILIKSQKEKERLNNVS